MKKYLTIIGLLLLATVSISVAAGTQLQPASAKKPAVKPGLKSGERLVYIVKWNELAAAKVQLETDEADKKDGYRVELKIDTIGMAKEIVVVKDRFTAFINGETRLPYRAEREILEGPKSEQGTIVYDQEKHTATIGNEKPMSVPPQTHDIASLLWAIRNVDLKAGTTERLQALNSSDKKVFVTIIETGKSAAVKTGAGTFQAVELAVKLQDERQPSDKFAIRIWISDDARRLPVLITAQPPFGKVRMELTDIGNEEADEETTENSVVKKPDDR